MNPISAEAAVWQLKEAGYEPLGPYPGRSDKPWPARCDGCGRTRRPRLSEIRRGLRCQHYQSQSAYYGRSVGTTQPKALVIAGLLRTGIIQGAYQVDDRLPSAEFLAKEHRISPTTARKSYRCLQDEGLVAVRPGIGTVVTRVPTITHVQGHGQHRGD